MDDHIWDRDSRQRALFFTHPYTILFFLSLVYNCNLCGVDVCRLRICLVKFVIKIHQIPLTPALMVSWCNWKVPTGKFRSGFVSVRLEFHLSYLQPGAFCS